MSEPNLTSLTEQLTAFLADVQRETNVPGIGVAVSVAGQRAYAQVGTLVAGGRVPLTADACFQVGCIMKLLLALTALGLAERGVLDAEAELGEYLPELAGAELGRTVLLRHLLAHTSGYRGTDIMEPAARTLTWNRFVAYLRDGAAPFFVPGSVFNYEHSEAVLLAAILERVTGRGALDAVTATVLAPLSIMAPVAAESCGPDVRVVDHRYDSRLGRFVPEDAPAPAGFWRAAFSTAALPLRDLLAVAETLTQPSRRPAVAALLRSAVCLPPMTGGPLSELLPIAFGHGAAVLRDGWFGNTGVARGQCVGLRFAPRHGVAVAVGLNAFAPQLRDLILGVVCACVTGRQAAREEPPRVDCELGALEGTYAGNGRRVLVVEHRDERLLCTIGRADAPHKLHAELFLDDARRLRVVSPAPQLALGVGRDPATAEPLLMVGLNAFKRMRGTEAAARAG